MSTALHCPGCCRLVRVKDGPLGVSFWRHDLDPSYPRYRDRCVNSDTLVADAMAPDEHGTYRRVTTS